MTSRPSADGRYLNFHCDKCDVYLHSRDPRIAYVVGLSGYGEPPRSICDLCEHPPVPAPTRPMPDEDEILELAIANGFSDGEDESGVGGDSSRDRAVCVGEYACGDAVIRFAHALLEKYGLGQTS